MSLKSFVNNRAEWDAFCDYLDEEITVCQRRLEQSDDSISVYRAHGQIMALRRIKYLRDKINGQG